MKKIIATISLIVVFTTAKAQTKSLIFVGLNKTPFYVNVGFEINTMVSKKMAIFVRPHFNKRYITNSSEHVTFIDVPIGLKFVLVGKENAGVGYTIDFNAGPYIGYAVKGDYFTYVGPTLTTKPLKFGKGSNAQYDPLDYGFFLNTQLNLGNTFGFGISAQSGLASHDLSKLGFHATNIKGKTSASIQVTVFFMINKKNKKK